MSTVFEWMCESLLRYIHRSTRICRTGATTCIHNGARDSQDGLQGRQVFASQHFRNNCKALILDRFPPVQRTSSRCLMPYGMFIFGMED